MANQLFKPLTTPNWRQFSDEELLDLSIKDVHIDLKHTGLMPYLNKLYQELRDRGIAHFRPHFWFSDEWFCPDGVSGIAIPFYLAHSRLAKLEERKLYEVEGGNPTWFMQMIRHECGHAIDNAYQLRRKKIRQKIFGKSSVPYNDYYVPRPFSKRYVNHLDSWYSQSHPDEDFAETFAIWLTPRLNWKKRFRGWKALDKLYYMDELMEEIGVKKPIISSKEIIDPQKELTNTLREYYRKRQSYYCLDTSDIFDAHLDKLFAKSSEHTKSMKASAFIKKIKKEAAVAVSPWTGTFQYTIKHLIDEIIDRAHQLDLCLCYPLEHTKLQFISMLSVVALEYISCGKHKVPR